MSIANDASALSVIVITYLLSLMIQMQHRLVSAPSTSSPLARSTERFTPFHVLMMIREMPSFLLVFLAKAFGFFVFCDVMTATIVNLHSFKVSYSRQCRQKNMPATLLLKVVPIFTWEHLSRKCVSPPQSSLQVLPSVRK